MTTLNRAFRIVWIAVRFPILAVLAICEPVVGFVLSALALLMVLAAAFWAVAAPFHAVAVWGLLAGAAGMILLLVFYDAAISALSA